MNSYYGEISKVDAPMLGQSQGRSLRSQNFLPIVPIHFESPKRTSSLHAKDKQTYCPKVSLIQRFHYIRRQYKKNLPWDSDSV